MAEPFIAEIRMFTYTFAPRGWAYCNGQIMPISQNPSLFSLLGTTYGGDGITTFGLPNLQGRIPMHPGRGPGLSSYRLGQAGGSTTDTLTEAQIPDHTHEFTVSMDAPTSASPGGQYPARHEDEAKRSKVYKNNPTLPLDAQFNSAAIGQVGGQAHENMQPYLTVSFCIALVGIFPSRS
jgi:microcystin-dependent protein